jgi:hypothetical protein
MKINTSIIVNTILALIILSSILFVGLTSSQPSYDPWLDVTDDGYGGIDDIVSTAEHFGASGDPTKLCNITNWPTDTFTTIWWFEPVSTSIASDWFNRTLFAHVTMMVMSVNMPFDSLTIYIHGRFPNPSGGASGGIQVHKVTITPSNSTASITIPIPSDQFRFAVYHSGSTDLPRIYLGFYRSWA